MSDISMTFENNSGTLLNQGPTGWDGAILAQANSFNQYPDKTLAGFGTQTMSMSALLGASIPEYDIWCSWLDPKTNIGFGVKIHVPVQLIDIGTAPYWLVSSGPASALTDWQPSGSDPSQSYAWPASVGYKVYASPAASHSGLNLTIYITPLAGS